MRLITETELAGPHRCRTCCAVPDGLAGPDRCGARHAGTACGHQQPAKHQQCARKPSLPQHAAGDLIPGIAAAGCPAAVALPVRARPAAGRLDRKPSSGIHIRRKTSPDVQRDEPGFQETTRQGASAN
jgi:hypothetical protein